jgi:hypothetical protein
MTDKEQLIQIIRCKCKSLSETLEKIDNEEMRIAKVKLCEVAIFATRAVKNLKKEV